MRREQFRDTLVSVFGEPFAYSYFDRSNFTEGQNPILYPWSHVANERFRDRAMDLLRRHGVKLGPVIAEHLKPKTRHAA